MDKPTDAIAALLQERHRYEQWLGVLESRRASTPPHVYARVRADYEDRLGRVVDELGGRSAELRQVVDSLSHQVSTLQTEENAKRDLQAEAELRAAVGEYSPEQWRELSQASEGEIVRISSQRAEAAAELAQVQQLLTMAMAPRTTPPAPRSVGAAGSRPAHPPPAPASGGSPGAGAAGYGEPGAGRSGAPSRGAERTAAPGVGGSTGRTGPAHSPPAPQHGFDELAFLQSVVEARGESAAADGGPPSDVDAEAEAEADVAADVAADTAADTAADAADDMARRPPAGPAPDAAAHLPAPQARGRTPAQPAPVSPPPHAPAAAPSRGSAAPAAAPASAPASAPPVARPAVTPAGTISVNRATGPTVPTEAPRRPAITGSVPAFLRDVPAEQVKTLKCAECGTMNYPTEWYCERCGGELAAM